MLSAQRPVAAGTSEARVSVIVPARDEAGPLPALLESLTRQSRRPHEVIVVDDQSDDGTSAVAVAAGAMVIRADGRPDGWLGKPWACRCGAAVATGDLLVFLDADTVAAPEFMDRLQPMVEAAGGLVSVAPFHQTRQPYEQASALFNLVAIMGVGTSSMRRRARVAGAFGPCLAMRKDDYAAIGGHAAVRGEVLDDLALARAFERHGLPVTNLGGGTLFRYRMYPGGVSQLVEGWSKNFAAGAGRTPPIRLLAIVAWLSGLIEAGWWTVAGAAGATVGDAPVPWRHAAFYVLFAWQLSCVLRRIGSFTPAAWLHPLAGAAFLGICARSVLARIRGEVTWKGRRITTSRSAGSRD
jgi:4,4'-diaponeurosporenoate glycosyltransferase